MTVHHQPAQSAITTNSPGTPHASSGRAHAISPATRFRHPCPPLARCWLALGILPALASNAGSLGTGPLLANPYSTRPRVGKGYRHLASLGASPLFHRSPPARAGGTAGRWARDAPGSPPNRSPPTRPIRAHDHHAQTLRSCPRDRNPTTSSGRARIPAVTPRRPPLPPCARCGSYARRRLARTASSPTSPPAAGSHAPGSGTAAAASVASVGTSAK